MSRDEKRDLMLEWFYANYEDPAQRTPYESAEGGYIWIWGGPYYAEYEIRDAFEGLASEALIKEVVNEIDSDGLFEWAPVPRSTDYDDTKHENDERLDEANEIDALPDVAGPAFGSSKELQARCNAIDALRALEYALGGQQPGIGHNHPPEPLAHLIHR